jgi:outer membrane protein assembly factor BamD
MLDANSPAFRLTLLTVLAALALVLPGCSSWSARKDEKGPMTAVEMYNEAKQTLKQERYQKAIELYERLETRYPFGVYATQAQLDIGYAHYKAGEPDSAIAAADRFIKLHPRHPAVPYAYYLKGLVNFNRSLGFLERFFPTDSSQRDPGTSHDSFKDFRTLIEKYPDSRYTLDARQRMISLWNNLAMYEIHVGRYYMNRKAYIAAVKRMIHVVQEYQATPAVPVALKIMETAYTKLAMKDMAADTARVYDLNYPNGIPNAESIDLDRSLAEAIWDFIGLDED